MICPFRINREYELSKYNGNVVLTGVKESYLQCYEEECPCYIYPDMCTNIEKEE